jgi:hypothetical protein
MAIRQTDLDQMLNQARVKLTGSSDAGLKGELFDVITEFLNDSSIWTQDVPLQYRAGVQVYPISVTSGQILRLVGIADWGTTVPTPTTVTPASAQFMPALMPDVGTLVLKNPPNTVGNMLVTVVTNINLPTDKQMVPDAPDWLLPIWHVGLLDGLLGRMMLAPNKSYSNRETAAYHLKRFRDAIARARVSKLRANTIGSAAWRFPQQFRSVSQQSGVPAIGSANERSF